MRRIRSKRSSTVSSRATLANGLESPNRKASKWLSSSIFAILVTLALNSTLISISELQSPSLSERATLPAVLKKDPSVIVYDSSELTLGGLPFGHFGDEVLGYTDFFASQHVIYINEDNLRFSGLKRYVTTHEYAHVLQKRYLEHRSELGGPGRLNPLATMEYLRELLLLDSRLRELMPETALEGVLVPGLESAAECYAEAKLMEDDVLRLFSPYYFEPRRIDGRVIAPSCSPEQRAIAQNYEELEARR